MSKLTAGESKYKWVCEVVFKAIIMINKVFWIGNNNIK